MRICNREVIGSNWGQSKIKYEISVLGGRVVSIKTNGD
jgi:hypothetical protein